MAALTSNGVVVVDSSAIQHGETHADVRLNPALGPLGVRRERPAIDEVQAAPVTSRSACCTRICRSAGAPPSVP